MASAALPFFKLAIKAAWLLLDSEDTAQLALKPVSSIFWLALLGKKLP